MKKERFRQLLTIFSLFMLLVLPTAIVGYSNFSTIVNRAFGKPFQKQESTFLVQTESSSNIAKGGQFSLKVSATAPQALPLKHFAAFIEYDGAKVDIKSVQLQNQKLLTVIKYQNGYLIYPKSMTTPQSYASLLPAECKSANTCDLSSFSSSSVTFTISGVLLSELSQQQRPIKVTMVGAAETSSIYVWNEKIVLPTLKLGTYTKNSAPQFLTEPDKYVSETGAFTYTVQTSDADQDPVLLSLACPEAVFCTKAQNAPEGVTIEGNTITWSKPVYQEKPYEITVYANDGKSVSTQTFSLKVIQKDSTYFTCTFTPAIAVKILDYRVETPLVVVAESSANLSNATVTLSRNNAVEKTFNYTLAKDTKKVILDSSSKPPLRYKFNEGQYTGRVVFTTDAGKTLTCELDNPTVSLLGLVKQAAAKTVHDFVQTVKAATGLDVGTNSSPVFTTDPMASASNQGSSPSVSFVYGTVYSFTLKAQDQDGDPLQHTIVTKPEWAAVTVTSTTPTTGPSTYDIQFTGTPQTRHAGSNLFSVSVNDGYGHYITRTWVINVDYPNNDIPRVTILEPTSGINRYQGSPFLLRWEVEDRYQVVSFGIYYTKSLSSGTRTAYNRNVSYRTRGLTINTASLPPGDYYFIVTATDGFSPPATGSGYTALVRILPKPKPTATPKPTAKPTVTTTVTPSASASTTPKPTATPTVTTTPVPDEMLVQITSPKNQEQIAAANFQTVISFTASKEGELTKDSVVVKLDGEDISSKFTLSTNKGKTITASYKPSVLLEPGVHELVAHGRDSKLKEAEAKVVFTISEDQGTQSNSVNFLGFDIPKNLYTIFIAALVLIAILVLLPIIMYFAFRNSDRETPPTARKVITPIQPAGGPSLRSPTASFVTPAAPQSTQTPATQPVVQQKTFVPPITPQVTRIETTQAQMPPTTPVVTKVETQKATPVIITPPSQPAPKVEVKPAQVTIQPPVQKPPVVNIKVEPPKPVTVTTMPKPVVESKPLTNQQNISGDIPRITPKQALEAFITNSAMDESKKKVPQEPGTPTFVTKPMTSDIPKPMPSTTPVVKPPENQKPAQTVVKPTTPTTTSTPVTPSNSVKTPPTVPNKAPATIPGKTQSTETKPPVPAKPEDKVTLPSQPQSQLPPESPPLPIK